MINHRTIIEIVVGLACVSTVVLLTVLALDYDPLLQSARSKALIVGVAAVIGCVSTLAGVISRRLRGAKATYAYPRAYRNDFGNTPPRARR